MLARRMTKPEGYVIKLSLAMVLCVKPSYLNHEV
ncbi:hypothetical protein H4S14_000281 [Agrobacterium vitis]|nr:hypothetical protein [Agrobacterium vitis]MBE1436554.1 hypothetical protein [Agrobacterium vitis]